MKRRSARASQPQHAWCIVSVHYSSLDPRPSPSSRNNKRVTFEPCAELAKEPGRFSSRDAWHGDVTGKLQITSGSILARVIDQCRCFRGRGCGEQPTESVRPQGPSGRNDSTSNFRAYLFSAWCNV